MLATIIHAPRDIRVEEVPDPQLLEPTDAIVRIVAACVCGSDLWPYRGDVPTRQPHPIGHEFVGVVEEVGDAVERIAVGDFVIAPFYACDMTCQNCRNGFSSACLHAGWWGGKDDAGHPMNGGQGERARVPLADGTLTATPEYPGDDLIPSLLTLSDVFLTGHHAAVSAGVTEGTTVAVIGDGAVGLSAVLAATRLGAARVVAVSRHADRRAMATEFGATDLVAERGDEGVERLKDMFDGLGPDAVLECVGTKESMTQAVRSARAGGAVGYVGSPSGGSELPIRDAFTANIRVAGGMAPVRNYIDEVLPDVWERRIDPGRVFTQTFSLTETPEAYAAMDERRAIKSLVLPSA